MLLASVVVFPTKKASANVGESQFVVATSMLSGLAPGAVFPFIDTTPHTISQAHIAITDATTSCSAGAAAPSNVKVLVGQAGVSLVSVMGAATNTGISTTPGQCVFHVTIKTGQGGAPSTRRGLIGADSRRRGNGVDARKRRERHAANRSPSLWILPTFGDKKPYRLFESSHSHLVTGAQFSPDVRWLAYQSDETERNEVYIVPFPEANRKIPVSTGGGGEPCWSPDGQELYYLSGDRTLMSATLQLGKNGLQVSSTRPLFKTNSETFDVSHDGKRFLVFEESENQPPSAITLITNWTKALPK